MKNKFFYTCFACVVIAGVFIITSFNANAINSSVFSAKHCSWKQYQCTDGSSKYYDVCVDLIGDGEGCKCGSVTRNCIGGHGGGGAE